MSGNMKEVPIDLTKESERSASPRIDETRRRAGVYEREKRQQQESGQSSDQERLQQIIAVLNKRQREDGQYSRAQACIPEKTESTSPVTDGILKADRDLDKKNYTLSQRNSYLAQFVSREQFILLKEEMRNRRIQIIADQLADQLRDHDMSKGGQDFQRAMNTEVGPSSKEQKVDTSAKAGPSRLISENDSSPYKSVGKWTKDEVHSFLHEYSRTDEFSLKDKQIIKSRGGFSKEEKSELSQILGNYCKQTMQTYDHNRFDKYCKQFLYENLQKKEENKQARDKRLADARMRRQEKKSSFDELFKQQQGS